MKQDTLEEIVREFAEGFEWTNKDLALKEWLRRSLTSYRKDVLEEVLAALPEPPVHFKNKPGQSRGYTAALVQIRHLIKSLKVDI